MQVYTADAPATRFGQVKIGIADFAVPGGENTLATNSLGSCIGVALYDPETDVPGLIHAMLPEVDDGSEPTKFVDTSVELLIAEMQAVGTDTDRIVTKIAGGSTMFSFTSAGGDGSIDNQNVAATRTTLDGFGVDAVAEDVSGSYGRSLELDSETGDLRVRSAKSGTHVF